MGGATHSLAYTQEWLNVHLYIYTAAQQIRTRRYNQVFSRHIGARGESSPPFTAVFPLSIVWLTNVLLLASCVHIAGTLNFMLPDYQFELNLELIPP